MEKKNKKLKWLYNILRFVMVFLFMAGFIYQTFEFLFLYWTYPTVVDIQQSSPSYVEVPAFTFCNRIGYNFENICSKFDTDACPSSFFNRVAKDIVCGEYSAICINGTELPKGFQTIYYSKFIQNSEIKTTDFQYLAMPLEKYLNCTIEFAGHSKSCNMEHVLGSFYSTDDLPQFCFTIYSLWGQPNKKRDVIPKGATMKFNIFVNITRRPRDSPDAYLYEAGYAGPLYNPPNDASVQIAIHSPYFLPSPFFEGYSFLGGRAYELRIKLSESHLLPLPYQTNCTDYMTTWRERGGKAPINQLSLIQECRINETYEALGCIPITLDYPHSYNICKACEVGLPKASCIYEEPPNNCTLLADNYNQPCDSMVYIVEKEDKVISLFKNVKSDWLTTADGIRINFAQYDCERQNSWRPEGVPPTRLFGVIQKMETMTHFLKYYRTCSTIDIDIPFDRFEITNITYNPKFESLELFSVIGGYMGMWLGISLLTVFDLFCDGIAMLKVFLAKKKKRRSRKLKPKNGNQDVTALRKDKVSRATYNVW